MPDFTRWLGTPPEPLAGIVEARVSAVRSLIEGDAWGVVALPRRIAAIHGIPPGGAAALEAGCILFYLAADIIDDAQDGDLPEGLWWPQAVNAGNALLFGALAAFAEAAPGVDVAGEVARAGQDLSWGQASDLASSWDCPMSEIEVLTSVRRKSGSSCRLFARLGAHAAGQAEEIVSLWGKLGETWGTMTQLRSDALDLQQPDSKDFRQRKATLPIASTLARNPTAIRKALASNDASELHAALRSSGALAFLTFTIDTLVLEIEQIAGELPLSDGQRADLVEVARSKPAPAFV